jgi:formate-nitrite transporter family protein
VSISFSVLAQAVLTLHLPDTPWRPVVAALGYPLGFLMVVLGRQQLFTENTITIVLPVMAERSLANLRALGRVWSIVLVANMAGTLLAAAFCSLTPVVTPETLEAMRGLGRDLLDRPVSQMFFYAITAGYLIANMVWMKPAAEGNQVLLVVVMTYLVAIAGSAHIVAGSVEAFLLVIAGELGVGEMLWRFSIPVLLGNIVGGTALFAMLSYAQVMKELRP